MPPAATPLSAGRPHRTRWRGLPAANYPSYDAQDRPSYMYDYGQQW